MTAKLAPPSFAGQRRSRILRVTSAESFGIGQQQLNERANDLLSGDAGESEAVGGVSLPDVEGPVCGGGQVDGPSCSLAAGRLVELLSESVCRSW